MTSDTTNYIWPGFAEDVFCSQKNHWWNHNDSGIYEEDETMDENSYTSVQK
jgi:hypothetical protein